MPIVNSTIIVDHAQVDGRRRIWERHQDHLGVSHLVAYIAESADDVTQNLAPNAVLIEDQLAAAEIAANLEEAMGDEI